MVECELLQTCRFFNDKMGETPKTADLMKNRFCLGDKSECARYVVFQVLGREKVPIDMFPNEGERATAVIAGSRILATD